MPYDPRMMQQPPRARPVEYLPPAQQQPPPGLLDMIKMGQQGQALGKRANRPANSPTGQPTGQPQSGLGPIPAWGWLGGMGAAGGSGGGGAGGD